MWPRLIRRSRRSWGTACRTLLSAARVDPAPAAGDRGPGGGSMPLPGVRQTASAYDAAQQAVLGSGTQNVYLGGRERPGEPAVSITPPAGQRDESLPLRGRDTLLAELTGAGARVRVLHG